MSIKSLAKLANLSDAAKRFKYSHDIWAALKSAVHNVPYADAMSAFTERRAGDGRFSPEESKEFAGIFFDHVVSAWGVGDETGTRAEFVEYLTSEGLDDVLSKMMAHAGTRDHYRASVKAEEAEGNSPAPSAGT